MVELKLTPIELTYLAHIFGVRELMFIGDPFFGWLAEEIEAAWLEARDSLARKGALKEDLSTGEIVVDILAAASSAVLAAPEKTFVLSTWDFTGNACLKIVHLTSGLSLIYGLPEDPFEEICISMCFDPEDAKRAIMEAVNIKGGLEIQVKSFTLRAQDFWDAILAFGMGGIGEGIGHLITDRTEKLEEFQRVIGRDYHMSMIVKVFDLLSTSGFEGVGFLCGEKGLWCIEPKVINGYEYFLVEPVSEEVAWKRFNTLLSS